MSSILTWSLDKVLYLVMLPIILFVDDFDSFEKGLLILMVAILISLTEIKDAIKNSNK